MGASNDRFKNHCPKGIHKQAVYLTGPFLLESVVFTDPKSLAGN